MLTGTRADTPSMPITLDLVVAPPCGTIGEGSQRRPLLQGDSGVICVKDAVSARQVGAGPIDGMAPRSRMFTG